MQVHGPNGPRPPVSRQTPDASQWASPTSWGPEASEGLTTEPPSALRGTVPMNLEKGPAAWPRTHGHARAPRVNGAVSRPPRPTRTAQTQLPDGGLPQGPADGRGVRSPSGPSRTCSRSPWRCSGTCSAGRGTQAFGGRATPGRDAGSCGAGGRGRAPHVHPLSLDPQIKVLGRSTGSSRPAPHTRTASGSRTAGGVPPSPPPPGPPEAA